MIAIVVAALAITAALIQIGPLSLVTADPIAVPLLPVAIIAGWGVARRTDETWLALLLAPAIFGVASHDRVGLYVLALWPTAALALVAHRFDHDPAGNAPRRLAGAAAAAMGGALCYVALIASVTGHVGAIPAQAAALLAALLITALGAATVALAVWPWRPRPRGLFE